MQYVPVISSTGKPLMPCHPARARELVHKGRAVRRFNKGAFYIRLLDREGGERQEIAIGVDPGSKREGITVASAKRTLVNLQLTAVTWVKDHIKTRREMRRTRRYRKTPCRANRKNRARGGLPPSTKARWQWKLRVCRWLSSLYPIDAFVIEDVCAATQKGQRRWNVAFSPMAAGKAWFNASLREIAPVYELPGHDTFELREKHDVKKTKRKLAETFSAHCVDSWVLAKWFVGGRMTPDNERLWCLTPLRFHRRQLHRLQPEKGGKRKSYGGTRSLGFKRGSLVKHAKRGLCYVGGTLKNRVSLHDLRTGKRLTQSAKAEDCQFLAYNSWRSHYA